MNITSTMTRRVFADQNTPADVTVPLGSNGDIIEFDVSQITRLVSEIRNTGANAFDTFIVQGKVPNGAYVTLLSVAADYTSPAGIVVDASGDLTTLAGGATGWLILDVLGFEKIKFQASAAVGASTARVFSSGS